MDAAILHDRLAAAEGAIIATDGRLDALENSEEHAAALARITSLEEQLTVCLERLQTSETTLADAVARIAEAQADEAEAQAEIAEAQAEMVTEIPEPVALEETSEETADEEITELEPEPESDGEGPESNQPTWWERLFTLR
jgi:chromosome segregation ATPase